MQNEESTRFLLHSNPPQSISTNTPGKPIAMRNFGANRVIAESLFSLFTQFPFPVPRWGLWGLLNDEIEPGAFVFQFNNVNCRRSLSQMRLSGMMLSLSLHCVRERARGALFHPYSPLISPPPPPFLKRIEQTLHLAC